MGELSGQKEAWGQPTSTPRPQPGVPGLVWGDPESCRTPQAPLLQGLEVSGHPPAPIYSGRALLCSARSQAAEGLTPRGGGWGEAGGGPGGGRLDDLGAALGRPQESVGREGGGDRWKAHLLRVSQNM